MLPGALDRVSRRLASIEIPIVVLVAPALLFPTPARLLVLVAIALVWLCQWRIGARLIPSTPVNASLGVLLVMVLASLFVTFDVRFSLGKVSGVVLGVALFWAIVRWTNTPSRLRVATAAFALTGGALATIGILGTNWMDKFALVGAIVARLPKAIRGVPGAEQGFQPNAVAGCLVLFVPLQIALVTKTGRQWVIEATPVSWQRWVVVMEWLLLALTGGTLVLTQSRGAWAAALVAAAAFLAWHSRATRIAATAGVVVLLVVVSAIGRERVLNLAISQSGPGIASDVSGRMELWSRAIEAIEDFPVTGMGMNTFRNVMPVLYPTTLSAPDVDVAHAHNHLLQVALDLGIPGLVAYLAIWIGVATALVRTYRATESAYRVIASGLGVGFIAHFAFGMTDAIPLGAKVGVLFWFALALAISVDQVTRRHQSAKPACLASS